MKAAQGDVSDCVAKLDASIADPELVALCKRCLSLRREDRPATAADVAKAAAIARRNAAASSLTRHSTSKMASISTAMPPGREFVPNALRAPMPSSPNTSFISSE